MLKKMLPAAVAASLLAGSATAVQAFDISSLEISGNVALTSDYRFRGISQSNRDGAIQGGFDLGFENGIYVGTWGSSVNFNDTDQYDGSLELDYYAGWALPVSDNVGIDVGYIYYDYPDDDDDTAAYWEVYGKVSLWDLTVGLNYSDNYYGGTKNLYYWSADYSLGLLDNLSLDLHVGYSDLDKDGGFLANDEDSYTDYSAGLTTTFWAVDWSVAYVGTNLDKKDAWNTKWGDDTVVLTVSKSL